MNKASKIQEWYNEITSIDTKDEVNDILCDVVTVIIQVPGIKEAILSHVLNKEIRLDEENIHDVPFQYLWELLFDADLQEELCQTKD